MIQGVTEKMLVFAQLPFKLANIVAFFWTPFMRAIKINN